MPVPDENHFLTDSPYNISTFAVAEGNSDLIYVGHNNGQLWRTHDGTSEVPTWERLDDVAAMPNRWISRIVIDRHDHQRVHVSFMGWEPDNLWRTTNGGAAWEALAGGGISSLPAVPIGALAQHRARSDWLYVGTDIGTFFSTDAGATWNVSTGIPAVEIDEFVWQNDDTLVAATHGRGVFVGRVQPWCPGDIDDNGRVDNNDLKLVLEAWNTRIAQPGYHAGADVDGDEYIGNADLQEVIIHWAAVCE
jgi:photosystem II stability/assembly factor-like uncharacterized protein